MDPENFILALDQGTTGTTVCLLNHQGKMVASVNQEFPQIYPQPGWVEHDPEAIWRTVVSGIERVLEKAQIHGRQVAGIGITNQRETVVLWDRTTGKALHNAIVWQCRRTTSFCQALKKKGHGRFLAKRTGLVIDPYFSASKLNWLLENVAGARTKASAGTIKAGTIDSFLIWRLSAGQSHKTDVSNASRTQLMNIEKGDWDPELLKLFKVPSALLPEILSSSGPFAVTKGVPGLPDGVPITGVAGDQQAALFGQTCFDVGAAKCTFGTGSFMLMNTGARRATSKSGLLTTVAWRLKDEKKLTYALEGGAFVCGASVQWLRDQMRFIDTSQEVEGLARRVDSTDGVYLVPAFVGLGAPYWDPDARAALVGMTRGTSRAHVARATLEAMALQNVDILKAMEKDLGRKLKVLRVDGGAVHNDLLMQMQADFLGATVQRPRQVESTVLGAAFLAGLGVGYWPNRAEVQKVWAVEREFKAQLSSAARKKKLNEWHEAVKRVRATR